MVYFQDEDIFNTEMELVKNILEIKGYVLESDHPYAYCMQHGTAFKDVSDWLQDNGYEGKLGTQGYFENGVGAVYGLYDTELVSYERMQRELVKEAKRQAKMG